MYFVHLALSVLVVIVHNAWSMKIILSTRLVQLGHCKTLSGQCINIRAIFGIVYDHTIRFKKSTRLRKICVLSTRNIPNLRVKFINSSSVYHTCRCVNKYLPLLPLTTLYYVSVDCTLE